MLQILYACYKEMDERFVAHSVERVPKSGRVEALLMGSYAPISKAEIHARLPEVSVRTIERTLARLIKEGKVAKVGTYRDARYRRV